MTNWGSIGKTYDGRPPTPPCFAYECENKGVIWYLFAHECDSKGDGLYRRALEGLEVGT
jgi:hypothetical protein